MADILLTVGWVVGIALVVAVFAIDHRVNKLIKLNKEVLDHVRAIRESGEKS